MEHTYNDLLKEIGVDLALHDQLMEYNTRHHTMSYASCANRPAAMRYFDESFHASHGERVAEVYGYRKRGGKSIGTFCIYVPDEIALAAEVLPIPLCGGSHWSVDYADKMFPREICPLIRSTFGMAFSNTCPYKKLKDGVVGETTCDAKKKAWDLLKFEVMEVPQKKNERDRDLWRAEVRAFKEYVERLSGVRVIPERLKASIRLLNRKRQVLQDINTFRKLPNPPISGLDALLVSQVALNQDLNAFMDGCERLIEELHRRVEDGVSAYAMEGPRVLIAGTPSPMGNWKVHYAVESSGLQIVADETCTGIRYFRDLVDEAPDDLEGMIDAIADRYFKIDCSCFSPNTERIEHVKKIIEEYAIDGVVQNILSFCHGYNVEAKVIEDMLAGLGIPSLKIVTDYSYEDLEQLKVRIESFRELLNSRNAA
ncbi:MAG: 2-hydroxyacyl-CoA dehydratase [Ignavibacteria bacterium]|nr:2-hydroxyacyl-CoA dehydratase [Ignavibacteria bacterium]